MFGAGQDRRQEAPFLGLAPVPDEGVAEHLERVGVVGSAVGNTGPGQFFDEDHLMQARQVASPVCDRPGDAQQPAPVERGAPLLDERGCLRRVFDAAHAGKSRRKFLAQDLANLVTEGLDSGAVMHHHKLKDTDDYCTGFGGGIVAGPEGVGAVTLLRPFDETGIVRDAGGTARFTGLPGSVPAFLDSVRRELPHQEAVRERGADGASLTYRQLWDRATRVSGGLRDAGIVPGDRVALTLGNGIDWVLGFLGTLMAGAVAVPVNSRLAPVERTFVLRDSGASLALRPGQALPIGRPHVEESLLPSDLACIVYTSGTTGAPKGAMLTFENLCVAAEVVKRELLLPFGEVRSLVAAPLFHVMGLANQLLPVLWTGGTAVIMPTYDATDWLDAITAEHINQLVAVPAVYWQALRHPSFQPQDRRAVGRLRSCPHTAARGRPHRRRLPAGAAGSGIRPHRIGRQRLLAAARARDRPQRQRGARRAGRRSQIAGSRPGRRGRAARAQPERCLGLLA